MADIDYWDDPIPPGDTLDYVFDWKAKTNGTGLSDWLPAGVTISSYTVTVPAGVTLASHAAINSDSAVRAWLVAGVTEGEFQIDCQITDSQGRIRTKSRLLRIRA